MPCYAQSYVLMFQKDISKLDLTTAQRMWQGKGEQRKRGEIILGSILDNKKGSLEGFFKNWFWHEDCGPLLTCVIRELGTILLNGTDNYLLSQIFIMFLFPVACFHVTIFYLKGIKYCKKKRCAGEGGESNFSFHTPLIFMKEESIIPPSFQVQNAYARQGKEGRD